MIRGVLILLATIAPLGAADSPHPTLAIDPALLLTISGSPGSFHIILTSESLNGNQGWQVWTNLTLDASGNAVVQLSPPDNRSRFYKLFAPDGLVVIPPGSFLMGSPTSEALRSENELQHLVTIPSGFWMGRHEVTQEEYEPVVGINWSWTKGPSLPAESMNWYDATNYCAALTQREASAGRLPVGYVYRLPTEAEWEYACRAGTTTAFHYGTALRSGMANFHGEVEYDSSVGDVLNGSGVFVGKTTPVESYAPNAWGLYDMHGNVWEWCSDWWGHYPTGTVTDPIGPRSGTRHVLRGGSFFDVGQINRAAYRLNGLPDDGSPRIGFRVLLAPGR